MTGNRTLKLGAMIHGVGHGWGEWRHPDALSDASVNFRYYKEQAQLAEAAGFDFAFIADSLSINDKSSPHYLNRFEPLTILSALAAVTEHIGLVATITVSYTEPFQLARQLASLDHISGGRAGWNIVTSWLSGTADNFSQRALPPHAVRYRLAQEHLDVVKGLWDSWEDDAFVRDKAKGVFFTPGKLHTLNHQGEFFSVKGPLNIARSVQGQPVLFQAGTSEEGRNFAARNVDAIFVSPADSTEARDYYQDVKRRALDAGRDPDRLSILPGIRPIVGDDEQDAEDRYQQARRLTTEEEAVAALGRAFNDYDFSRHAPKGPFPFSRELEAAGHESTRGFAERVLSVARDGNPTLGEVALQLFQPDRTFVGTAEQVADRIQEWFQQGAADGFIVNGLLPDGQRRFAEKVVPLLRRRGLVREGYQGSTLRANLGLEVPANRYSEAARQEEQA